MKAPENVERMDRVFASHQDLRRTAFAGPMGEGHSGEQIER